MIKKNRSRSFRKSRYFVYKETLVDFKEHFWAFTGAFSGIGILAFVQDQYLTRSENVMLIGSFGASSVLIYGAIQSPLAQPRNLIGGHLISALIGVCMYKLFPDVFWLAAALSVSLSIVLMQMTKTLHPPGGATALIAVIGTAKIKALGFFYILFPVLSGAMVLLIVALIVNNITKDRKYPTSKRFTKMFMPGSKKSGIKKP